MNLLAPPSSLLTPGMLLRVWRANRQRLWLLMREMDIDTCTQVG